LREEVSQKLSRVRPITKEEQESLMQQMMAQAKAAAPAAPAAPVEAPAPQGVRREGFDETDMATWGNPARNDQCPCGSGKKFKHCHGTLV
jgi:preprotein translocase subunit SecA